MSWLNFPGGPYEGFRVKLCGDCGSLARRAGPAWRRKEAPDRCGSGASLAGAASAGLVPVVCVVEVQGTAGGTVARLDVVQAPVDLGPVVSHVIGAGARHLRGGQGLDHAVGAAAGVGGSRLPVRFLRPELV